MVNLPAELERSRMSWPALDWAMGRADRRDAYLDNFPLDADLVGISNDEVVAAIQALTQRHPTLRTRYLWDGARGTQVLHATPDAELIRSLTSDSVAEHSFDLDHELPFAVELGRSADGVPHLRIVIDHIATDLYGAGVLQAELSALLQRTPLPAATGFTPFDLARWEASPDGIEWQQSRERGWRRHLTTALQRHESDRTARLGPTPRQSSTPVQQQILWCRRLGGELSRSATQLRTFESAIALAAIAAAHRHVLDQQVFVAQTLSVNRWSRRGRSSSAKFFMQGPVLLENSADGPQGYRGAHEELVRSLRLAYADPQRIDQLIDESGSRPVPGIQGLYYNYVLADPSMAMDRDGDPTWMEQCGDAGYGPGIVHEVWRAGETLRVAIRHNPISVQPADVTAMLEFLAEYLTRACAGDNAPA